VEAATAAVRKPLPPGKFKNYLLERLGLRRYFEQPGDGRPQPQIPARGLLWSFLIGTVLRKNSFHGLEALAHSPARQNLKIPQKFGNDTLSYFTERLATGPLRQAVVGVLRRAKRNKAFDEAFWIGLILDGTGVARSTRPGCHYCLPIKNQGEITGHNHKFSLACLTAGGLVLPADVEPYLPGGGEQAASRTMLRRLVGSLGPRFAQYVVWDSLYANAPTLHEANDLGLYVAAPLKENLPSLYAQARARFEDRPPALIFQDGKDRVELWDGDDFDPWDTLRWTSVRVLRYRVGHPDGKVCQGYWLTDIPTPKLSSKSLFRLGQGRWGIENHGFNDGKNRYGLEHITHHHANSLLVQWLLICLALTCERLFRLRYLRRGYHTPMSAADLLLLLWIGLGRKPNDTS
jgi:hypothetical protein